jgi:hypothetical protein
VWKAQRRRPLWTSNARMCVVGFSLGVGLTAAGDSAGTPTVPAWVTESRPIKPEDVPDGDYAFLRD